MRARQKKKNNKWRNPPEAQKIRKRTREERKKIKPLCDF
jgi:hypothetical protein